MLIVQCSNEFSCHKLGRSGFIFKDEVTEKEASTMSMSGLKSAAIGASTGIALSALGVATIAPVRPDVANAALALAAIVDVPSIAAIFNGSMRELKRASYWQGFLPAATLAFFGLSATFNQAVDTAPIAKAPASVVVAEGNCQGTKIINRGPRIEFVLPGGCKIPGYNPPS